MTWVILQHRFLGHGGGIHGQVVSSLATPGSLGNVDSPEGLAWSSFYLLASLGFSFLPQEILTRGQSLALHSV